MTMRAFTLVEMLATLVIVTIVASIGASALVGIDRDAAVRRVAAAWQDLDRRARVLSLDEGPLVLELTERGPAVRRVGDDTPHWRLDVPSAVRVVDAPERLVIDRHGRSEDYVVVIRSGDIEQRWSMHGILGDPEER